MVDIKKAGPYLTGLAFASIFGFSFLITKNTLGKMAVFQLLGIRFLLAAVVFELLRITKIVKIKLSGKLLKDLLPVAVFQPGLYFIFEIYGVKNAESGEAGLMIGMIPVAVALVSWIFLKEKLNKKQAVFMVLSLAGVSLIGIMQMNSGVGASKPLGYIMLSGAIISAAFYNLLSRKSSLKYKPVEITYVMMLFGAIIFNIIGITDSIISDYSYFAPLADYAVVFSIIYLGVLSSIIAFFCVNYTLSRLPAVQSSLFSNLITVISIIAGVVFLKENMAVYKIIGSILIVIGVFGTNYFHYEVKRRLLDYASNDY